MDCVICYEPIKDFGFLCRVCVDGAMCDRCFFNGYMTALPLYIFPMIMFKLIKCPVCRTICAEEFEYD